MAEIKELIQLQENRLKAIQKHQEILRDPTQTGSKFILEKKMELFKEFYGEFHETDNELCSKNRNDEEINPYFSNEVAFQYENIYFELHALLMETISQLPSEQNTIHSASQPNISKIRLPILQPPTFSGRYIEWTAFWDQFTALIDSHPDLHQVQKMQYLKAALQGSATHIIKHLGISGDNYELAKKMLRQRFENKRAIFTNAMNQLLSMSRKKDSVSDLQSLSAVTQETIQSLKNIEINDTNSILAYLIINKMPIEARKEFERKAALKDELPSIQDVETQIQSSIRTLESMEMSKSHGNDNAKPSVKSFVITKKGIQSDTGTEKSSQEKWYDCQMCQQQHGIRNCPQFLELPTTDKRAKAESLKLCYNCLSPNHVRTKCLSKQGCRTCGKNHHSLLHLNDANEPNQSKQSTNDTKVVLTSKLDKEISHGTLLATAIVKVQSADGHFFPLRALLDVGGEASVISESAVQLLRLKKTKYHVDVTHLDSTQSKSSSIVSLNIQSCLNSFQVATKALVMNSLTSRLPSKEINTINWPHISDLQLADPNFNKIGAIDLILGADIYADIIQPEIRRGIKGSPTAQKTQFGWILFGRVHHNAIQQSMSILTFTIEEMMEKFMMIENMDENQSHLTKEEQYCVDFYNETTQRDENGRFIIRFPFRTQFDSTAILGRSRTTALLQFLQLERKFAKNAEFKEKYSRNIHEFFNQGYLTELNDKEEDHCYSTNDGVIAYKSYYLPHHPVVNEASSSTPIRIVFNASKRTSNNKALNEVILPGPTLLNDLITILINWRCHRVAFIADIQKMYLQIKVHPEDMQYQRILWRDNPSQPIKDYAINRLSFGLNFAPFAAIQTMITLAEENEREFPISSNVMKKYVYMDDLISGSSDVETALKIQRELIQIVSSAGFNFKKWASNSEEVLLAVPETHREIKVPLSLYLDKTIKTLGIHWNSASDMLHFSINLQKNEKITKRTVLSSISKIYDPLGLLSPIIVKAKILMKKLWIAKLQWDELLPTDLIQEWNELVNKFDAIPKITIPRWINIPSSFQWIELHGFSDACTEAYGAVIYFRCLNNENQISSAIVLSKSRISPIKTQTIPRLELCGALLLSKLMKFVITSINVINLENVPIFLWTDSQIVLHWIRGESNRWKTFVSNRIEKIKENSNVESWNYVATAENPADLVSRGAYPEQLSEFWFNGPAWLKTNESKANKIENAMDETTVEEELKSAEKKMYHQTVIASPVMTLLHSSSSLIKLFRYTCWLKRFYRYLRNKGQVQKGPLTTEELRDSNINWTLYVQRKSFHKEIEAVRGLRIEKSKGQLKHLTPFLDEKQLLRVGGRLTFANIPFDEKHPMILPHEHYFTKLVINQTHLETLHGGTQSTLAQIRRKFWILKGRKAVQKVIHQCVICHRMRGQTSSQLMASLPTFRVTSKRPFLHTGVDLCGPVLMRASKIRGSKIYKGYIALFICMTVKAVHLEPIMDLSSECFLMAFQRFVSRRGLCSDLYSDCGTNFIGAKKILQRDEEEYLKLMHESLMDKFTNKGVRFHFNPPSAPSFGGLWESNIRQVKHHLKRVIGDQSLTVDYLATILCRIEAILNSRPLIPMSDDPGDFSYLTPGHFLINDCLIAIPEPSMLDSQNLLTHSYKTMLQRVQTFWKLWHKDYLQSLQSRPKWLQINKNLEEGDVVLIKDERLPPLKWMMGRILQTHPGSDGLVRVCTVKTQNGTFKRPVVKLSPLPINEHQYLLNEQESDETIEHDDESRATITMLPFTISGISQKFTIAVEGNIGVGKSTLLNHLQEMIDFTVLPEPLPQWTNLGGYNLLTKLYNDPMKWTFAFQSFVVLTMMNHHLKRVETPFKIMERSIYSARYCFIEAARKKGILHSAEKLIFDEWFAFLHQQNPINVDLTIYLRCSPKTCMERILARGRREEMRMRLEDVQMLHELHDEWLLNPMRTLPHKLMVVDCETEEMNHLYNQIKSRIFQL